MKIAVSGTHSSGKTSFLNSARELFLSNGFTTGLVCDLAEQCPLPVLKNHSIESSLWIACQGIANELSEGVENNLVLVDRALIDSYVYMICSDNFLDFRCSPMFRVFEAMVMEWMKTYDVIYLTYVDSSLPPEVSEKRLSDDSYRMKIAASFIEVFGFNNLKARPLTSSNHSEELQYLLGLVKND